MNWQEWALLVASAVGTMINLGVVVKLAWGIGKWQGQTDVKICGIIERLDSFDKKYGDLPERVSYLEGVISGDKK